jgi:hypothetical protein
VNTVRLADIAEVLVDHPYFGHLDILASHVDEIVRRAAVFREVGERVWRCNGGEQALEMRGTDDANVVRFALVREPSATTAVAAGAAGAALGAAVGFAADERRSPANMVLGLLIGGVIGAIGGVAATASQPRAVLTLAYDAERRAFRVYHGPYVEWAKTRFGRARTPAA